MKKLFVRILGCIMICTMLVSALSSCEIDEDLLNSILEEYLGGLDIDDELGKLDGPMSDVNYPPNDSDGFHEGIVETHGPDDYTDPSIDTDPIYDAETGGNGDNFVDVPDDNDFEGIVVGINTRGVKGREQYRREFDSEVPSDPLDVKIMKRNSEVEKELNVKIKIMTDMFDGADSQGIIDFVKAEYQAGNQSGTDVLSVFAAYANAAALRGYYVNLVDNSKLPYLNEKSSYWNQSYVKAATCKGQLYTIVGDLNLSIYDKSIVTFFNAGLAKNYAKIDVDAFYDDVLNGDWTYKKLYTMVTEFPYQDNGTPNVVDPADKIPYASVRGSEEADGYLRAWDIQMVNEEVTGNHSLTIDGNTRLETGIANMQQLRNTKGVYLDSIENTFNNTFLAGNALFDVDILYRNATSNDQLRNCGFDYAILPLCKYEDKQTEYYTTPQDAYNAMSIFKHRPERLEAVSATLDLMCKKTHDDVRPYYIEKMVKATYVSGADQVKMLELVMNGTSFTTEVIYSSHLNNVSIRMWRDPIMRGNDMLPSWAAIQSRTEAAVQDFDAYFEAIKE